MTVTGVSISPNNYHENERFWLILYSMTTRLIDKKMVTTYDTIENNSTHHQDDTLRQNILMSSVTLSSTYKIFTPLCVCCGFFFGTCLASLSVDVKINLWKNVYRLELEL